MPNYCSNTITIKGSKQMMDRFKKLSLNVKIESVLRVFSFNPTVPFPDESNVDTITWRNKNWGTKWDACEPKIIMNTDIKVVIQCETAWGPPIEWAKNVVTPFNNLKIAIAYCEAGVNFYGETVVTPWNVNKNIDKKICNEEMEYNADIDDYIICGKLKEFMDKYQIRSVGG